MDRQALRQTIDVRGLRLAYSTWGEVQGAREIALCFHGFLDHGDSFAPVARALADQIPVVAVDFRGFGRSGWVGAGGYYHFMDYVGDVMQLHAALGRPEVHLLAHSMGGSVATTFCSCAGASVRSIVMLEGMGPPREDLDLAPHKLRRWVEALAEPALQGDVEARRASRKPIRDLAAAAERLQRTNTRVSAARALELVTYGTEPHDSGGVVWRFDPLHRTPGARPFNADEYAHHWREVKVPVLSLYGSASEWNLADVASRHALLDTCVVGLVDDAGHNIHHDQADVVAAACRRWFGGVRTGLPAGVRATGHDLSVT